MKNKNKKDIHYYLNLKWTYTIETDRDEKGNPIFIVSVNELPGIKTDAPTLPEAMELIKEAMIGVFKLYLKNKEEIPEPFNEDEFQGNIAYRTSSKRHYLLTKEAQRKNQSLSKIIDECIDQHFAKKPS